MGIYTTRTGYMKDYFWSWSTCVSTACGSWADASMVDVGKDAEQQVDARRLNIGDACLPYLGYFRTEPTHR